MHPFDSKDYRGVSFASQNCFDKLGFSLSKQSYVTNCSVCQGQFYSHKAGIFDKIKLGGSFVSSRTFGSSWRTVERQTRNGWLINCLSRFVFGSQSQTSRARHHPRRFFTKDEKISDRTSDKISTRPFRSCDSSLTIGIISRSSN